LLADLCREGNAGFGIDPEKGLGRGASHVGHHVRKGGRPQS
jgi:hypothetical protein